ncbi:T9SS C-terminal target domain-containing protein [Lewinella cohaerens]|uniref:T9SS C-terminal target domain-containing protein n=1 Tax=Lewinella cohaerens TaxID=70995 RepID=UPI00037612AE|nr:T9SS C-terminal target domain-containing protein [Lewinella cohaerens]
MKINLSPFWRVLLLLSSTPIFLIAQPTIQDCLGAVPVCQDLYSESQSPSGDGNIGNEIINGETCTAGELNSIWYVFTANEDGMLGFLITPNNFNDDYDWALFDLTNGDCDDLTASNLVSCNAAGGTGCHGPTGCAASGIGNWVPGGCGGTGPINALVPMSAGNTYVLMVSNWTGSNDGYSLDFSESTGLGVFDQTPPLVEDITQLPESCGDATIDISFNEFLLCNSINDNAFQLDGPGGPYTLDASSPDCISGSNQAKSFRLAISPPIQSMGDYTLTIDPTGPGDLLDLCDNQAESFTFNFTVDVPLPVIIDIGQDTSLVCAGDELVLDASSGGNTFLWEDGSTDPTLIVTNEGVYSVTVTDDCGFGEDAIEVFVQQFPPTVNFGADQIICPGTSPLLDADNGVAFYNWQDGSSATNYTVTTTGDYAVTVENGCGVVEEAINITYVPPLNLNLANEYVLCLGDTLTINIERPFATYQWSDGSTLPQRDITADNNFSLTVTTICEVYEADFAAIFLVDPMLDLGEDLILCPNDSLILEPGIPGATYLWQDGSTQDRFVVTTPNTYGVTISTACNDLVDSVVIDYLLPITTELGRDTFLCPEDPFLLDASTEVLADYQWENGAKEARRLIFGPGDYSITVSSICETVIDTIQIAECEICTVYMPNVFSPNNDGVNDRLFPQSHCSLEAYEMQVFDRWGSQVYQSSNPNDGWNGKIRGDLARQGTYVWMIQYTVSENGIARSTSQRGDVVLLR